MGNGIWNAPEGTTVLEIGKDGERFLSKSSWYYLQITSQNWPLLPKSFTPRSKMSPSPTCLWPICLSQLHLSLNIVARVILLKSTCIKLHLCSKTSTGLPKSLWGKHQIFFNDLQTVSILTNHFSLSFYILLNPSCFTFCLSHSSLSNISGILISFRFFVLTLPFARTLFPQVVV